MPVRPDLGWCKLDYAGFMLAAYINDGLWPKALPFNLFSPSTSGKNIKKDKKETLHIWSSIHSSERYGR